MAEPQAAPTGPRDMMALLVVVMLTLSMALNAWNVLVISRQAREGANAHLANCTYRAGLQDQVKQSVAYLVKHPDGVPALGITAGEIRRGIDRERRAVQSLGALDC